MNFESFFAFSHYHDSDGTNTVKDHLTISSPEAKLLIDILMQEIKSVVAENYELEFRN